MSNNDLYCHECKSHHHPACCPLDMSKDWLIEAIEQFAIIEIPSEENEGYVLQKNWIKLAQAIRSALLKRVPKENSARGLCSPYKEQKAFDDGYDEAIKDFKEILESKSVQKPQASEAIGGG